MGKKSVELMKRMLAEKYGIPQAISFSKAQSFNENKRFHVEVQKLLNRIDRWKRDTKWKEIELV